MLVLSLCTKCVDVVAGTFNSQDTVGLVIHFNCYITHIAFDTHAAYASAIVGSDFLDAVMSNALLEKSSDII